MHEIITSHATHSVDVFTSRQAFDDAAMKATEMNLWKAVLWSLGGLALFSALACAA